jgi:hypothetical protein
VRKRWRFDAFIHRVDVVGYVIGFLAFRDTDADALSGPAACVGFTVTDGGACALHGCVVLPAHQQREVLRTR